MTEAKAKYTRDFNQLSLVGAATLLSGSLLLAASAQESASTVDVSACLNISGEQERRECIDAQVDAFLEGRDLAPGSPPASQPATSGPRATESPSAQEKFGAAEPGAAAGVSNEATTGPAGQEYFGTIIELRERIPSAYVITLDNGQIWEQTEPKRFPLRTGLEVRIYPTRWGSRHRLSGIGTGGHIQVRRLR